jgi:predicted MFS family arabinose efflux permease
MLTFRLFRDRMFRTSAIVNFASSAAFVGLIFLLPLFLQGPKGLSATSSGLTTFPQAIGLILMSRLSSRLFSVIGPRRMMMIGTAGAAIATGMFHFVGLGTNDWWIRGIMFFRGASFSFALIPIQAATFANISREDSGRASSLFNTNRQVASSLGVAILATVLTDRLSAHTTSALAKLPVNAPAAVIQSTQARAATSAFHDGYLAAFAISVIAFFATFLIHDEDAAAALLPKTSAEAVAAH